MLPDRIPDRLALISDIHANKEALDAVFADIDRRAIKDVWCLGDIVGYGPSPVECLQAVRDRCVLLLMGNHDYAVVHLPLHFNAAATSAIRCHIQLLWEWYTHQALDTITPPAGPPGKPADHPAAQAGGGAFNPFEYLDRMPVTHKLGDITFVHSSPRDPMWEYLFVGEAYEDPERLEGVFDFIERVCFCGHTHYPGAVLRAANGQYVSLPARGADFLITLPVDWKAYVNVGSVGQPRDSDTRACYVELHRDKALFHRVAYDYRKTMARLKELPIHPRCAERLELGK